MSMFHKNLYVFDSIAAKARQRFLGGVVQIFILKF